MITRVPYDVAVWKQAGSLSDEAATEEFERRVEEAEGRYEDGLRERVHRGPRLSVAIRHNRVPVVTSV
ncbi:hypothetical protein [Sporichthya sp.]|uniref:hypothetical protein n=1 Tax=Sporichthya sp. TaxID=65475 RepID=UPI0017987A7A|nr:hypothetical protein [Sporichthya sp.]MBA3744960.1 hypothetical protein [Sporichthya sp.]